MQVLFIGAANPETQRMIRAVQASRENFTVIGFIDNDPKKKGTTFLGYPVFGGMEVIDQFDGTELQVVNLITGNTRDRFEVSRELANRGFRFTNFIHPSVDLTLTSIGSGNYFQESVVLQAGVSIGHNSSIHIGTLVGHESKIGHSVFIAHGCSISGLVEIGDGTFVGTHATFIPRLKIGRWVTIGAGTVVIQDVPDYATVVGNPGRVIRTADPIHTSGNPFGE